MYSCVLGRPFTGVAYNVQTVRMQAAHCQLVQQRCAAKQIDAHPVPSDFGGLVKRHTAAKRAM